MPWRYIDPYIERLSRHTTIYGKYWLCFVTVFRLTVLPFAESCWSDEQKEFKCNTQEIGCNNVCFNQFAPINQGLRVISHFWFQARDLFQIIGQYIFHYLGIIVSKLLMFKRNELCEITKRFGCGQYSCLQLRHPLRSIPFSFSIFSTSAKKKNASKS